MAPVSALRCGRAPCPVWIGREQLPEAKVPIGRVCIEEEMANVGLAEESRRCEVFVEPVHAADDSPSSMRAMHLSCGIFGCARGYSARWPFMVRSDAGRHVVR